jgi:hypothetical protein
MSGGVNDDPSSAGQGTWHHVGAHACTHAPPRMDGDVPGCAVHASHIMHDWIG